MLRRSANCGESLTFLATAARGSTLRELMRIVTPLLHLAQRSPDARRWLLRSHSVISVPSPPSRRHQSPDTREPLQPWQLGVLLPITTSESSE